MYCLNSAASHHNMTVKTKNEKKHQTLFLKLLGGFVFDSHKILMFNMWPSNNIAQMAPHSHPNGCLKLNG